MSQRTAKIAFLSAVFLVASSGIAYEIIAASVLSILLGSTIVYFSLTVGVYLAALGIGAFFSSKIEGNVSEWLIGIGSGAALLGGSMAALLFGAFAFALETIARGESSVQFRALNYYFWFFLIFSLLLIFTVGSLSGFSLPLFSRVFSQTEKLKDALGLVLFFDYLGAFAASLSLPVFLYPVIGIVRTSFLAGLVNSVGVLLFAFFAGGVGKNRLARFALLFSLASAALNAVGFARGEAIEFFLERKQFGINDLIFFHQSPYQRLELARRPDGRLVFLLNGYQQFESGEWDAAYHESFAHPALSYVIRRRATTDVSVLVLGSGDGLLLREIVKYPSVSRVLLVDIDEEVIRLAKSNAQVATLNQLSFGDKRVEVRVDDAFRFAAGRRREKFDVIFVGFSYPSDFNQVRLYSKEFYSHLTDLLREDGLMVVQTIGYSGVVHQTVRKTLTAAGLQVLPYHPPISSSRTSTWYGFGYAIASKYPIASEDIGRGRISVVTSYLRTENLPTIFDDAAFGKEMDKRNGPVAVNSVFRPVIFHGFRDIFDTRFFQSFIVPPLVTRKNNKLGW